MAGVGIEEYVERAGLRLNSGRFLGQVVYWFIVITFLLAASSLLGFVALSGFLEKVLTYIPQVMIAVLVMLVTVIVANFLRRMGKFFGCSRFAKLGTTPPKGRWVSI